MSIESAKLFIERMKTDENFTKKISLCKNEQDRSIVLKKEGYDFTSLELSEAGPILSDDDLDGVSGGARASVIGMNITVNSTN